MENLLINIHPADELAALRDEIRQLQSREDELRAILLKDGADLNGDQYVASIHPSTRESVDRNALIAELGMDRVRRFLKSTLVRSVKLVAKPSKG